MALNYDDVPAFLKTDPKPLDVLPRAIDKQVGGSHYKDLKIQPIEYILANNLGFVEGNVVKYITRYQQKGGREDLEKVKHYVELLLETLPPSPDAQIFRRGK